MSRRSGQFGGDEPIRESEKFAPLSGGGAKEPRRVITFEVCPPHPYESIYFLSGPLGKKRHSVRCEGCVTVCQVCKLTFCSNPNCEEFEMWAPLLR